MTLQNCIFCVVLLAISVTAVPLLEGRDQQKEVSRTFDEGGDGSVSVNVARVITKTLLVLGAAQVIYVLADDYILMPLGIDLNIRRKRRNFNEGWSFEEEMLRNVIDSIDPVNKSFSFMEIDEEVCRNKAVCEVSSIPWIATFVRYMSPTVRGLEKYKEAVDAGEALEDCSLLFAECKDTLL